MKYTPDEGEDILATDLLVIPKVKIRGWRCRLCLHEWRSYNRAPFQSQDIPGKLKRPVKCPRCFSKYWWLGRRRTRRKGAKVWNQGGGE